MNPPAIITALTAFSMRAMAADKPAFDASVLAPIRAALDALVPTDDDELDLERLRDKFSLGMWQRMGAGREARAEQLAVRLMQAQIIGQAAALEPLHRVHGMGIRTAHADERNATQDDRALLDKLLKWLQSTARFTGVTEDMFKLAPNFKALSALLRKTLLTSDEFDQLSAALKARAFRVWQVNDLGVIQSVRDQIRTALEDGTGYRTFVKTMQETLDKAGLPRRPMWHAMTVYQTNVATAYADAKNRIINTPVARAIFPFRRYMTRNNSSVRPTHAALHGLVYPSDHEFWATYDPPWDYNCVLEGSRVAGRFIGASRARYAGQAIELTTQSGKRLRVTPNHRVLSVKGFIPARTLTKGDDLLCHCGPAWNDRLVSDDVDEQPSMIEDVFRSLSETCESFPAHAGRVDFHGDEAFVDGEVDIVSSQRRLPANRKSGLGNESDEFALAGTHESLAAPGSRDRPAPDFMLRSFATQGRTPSRPALSLNLAAITFHGSPFDALLFTGGAKLRSVFHKMLRQPEQRSITGFSAAVDADLFRQGVDRFPGVVSADKIIEVRDFQFRGHVFDLSSEAGWYCSNGIAVSNCRCWTELVPASQARDIQSELPDMPPASDFTRANPGAIPDTVDDDLAGALRDEFDARVEAVTA